ncbi:MAG: hypothetical protein ACJ8F4_00690 [Sphingomonas sp.]
MWLIVAAVALGSGLLNEPGSADFMRYLIGTWDVVSADAAGGDKLRVCYSVQPFVGDKWISGSATSKTPNFGSKDVWGHDAASGELIRTIFDKSGTYAVVRSSGWKGDTLVLEGNARSGGGAMRVRETVHRVNGHEFTATWEAIRSGKWSPYAIERAKRVPARTCSTS